MFPRDDQCTDNAMRYDNVKKKYIILFQINTALISDKCIQTFLTNNGYNYNPAWNNGKAIRIHPA